MFVFLLKNIKRKICPVQDLYTDNAKQAKENGSKAIISLCAVHLIAVDFPSYLFSKKEFIWKQGEHLILI